MFFFVSMFSYFTFLYFFFNASPTTEIYTLSLHDALPISARLIFPTRVQGNSRPPALRNRGMRVLLIDCRAPRRSEEHTSELQSHHDLVCRLLLEKKKNKT